mmetsp:Transcript_45577/g.121186  ORF Transcript_45577/g.121186 Transcript_45577/m.121186 type:complete len:106 (+) Transcript_45577:366-683(+)
MTQSERQSPCTTSNLNNNVSFSQYLRQNGSEIGQNFFVQSQSFPNRTVIFAMPNKSKTRSSLIEMLHMIHQIECIFATGQSNKNNVYETPHSFKNKVSNSLWICN